MVRVFLAAVCTFGLAAADLSGSFLGAPVETGAVLSLSASDAFPTCVTEWSALQQWMKHGYDTSNYVYAAVKSKNDVIAAVDHLNKFAGDLKAYIGTERGA